MYEKNADVVIHIDEDIDDDYIHEIEQDLSKLDGVYSACVHERARHLMVVDYDPSGLDARLLLHKVRNHGLHAELIGL
ncbi:MAG: heavy-metal-associated domain-containing protein [bacterium]